MIRTMTDSNAVIQPEPANKVLKEVKKLTNRKP